jgi:lysozyme family protein
VTGNFNKCLELVLKSEGGYVNHPSDPGGRTNLGVTQAVWEEWVGHPVSENDMKALTADKVAPMYEMKYWRTSYCEKLPQGLNLLVFSMAVNSGSGRAVKLLQRTLGLVEDGAIGPITMTKIQECSPVDLVEKYSATRKAFYEGLKTFPIFGKGWLARTEKERLEALELLRNS